MSRRPIYVDPLIERLKNIIHDQSRSFDFRFTVFKLYIKMTKS
jgi:hypothetical protein